MDRKDFQPIGRVIDKLLESYRLRSKFNETQLINSWGRLVGKPVARLTRQLYMKGTVLFVRLDSPSVRNDFMLNKDHILVLFQKEFGEDVITKIVVL